MDVANMYHYVMKVKPPLSFSFQRTVDLFQTSSGEILLEWKDRFGNYHDVTSLGDNSCDRKDAVLYSNAGNVGNKSLLPIMGVRYGGLQFETQQARIKIAALICQPQDLDDQPTVLEQISDLRDKITDQAEELDANKADVSDQISNLQDKINDQDKKFKNFIAFFILE